MRANVRTLVTWCLWHGCNHRFILDASNYLDDVTVLSFGRRYGAGVAGT